MPDQTLGIAQDLTLSQVFGAGDRMLQHYGQVAGPASGIDLLTAGGEFLTLRYSGTPLVTRYAADHLTGRYGR